MISTVDIRVFKFIEELSGLIRNGKIDRNDIVGLHSKPVVFCDSFFTQLFKSVDIKVRGFSSASKAAAGEWAAWSRDKHPEDIEHKQVRLMISRYIVFCDIHSETEARGYGPSTSRLTYQGLHERFLDEFLKLAEDWANSCPSRSDLAVAATMCRTEYTATIEETEWLTKPLKSKFASWKSRFRKRTS